MRLEPATTERQPLGDAPPASTLNSRKGPIASSRHQAPPPGRPSDGSMSGATKCRRFEFELDRGELKSSV
eukprot:11333868-Alexandrium_andersonii.AAC.1